MLCCGIPRFLSGCILHVAVVLFLCFLGMRGRRGSVPSWFGSASTFYRFVDWGLFSSHSPHRLMSVCERMPSHRCFSVVDVALFFVPNAAAAVSEPSTCCNTRSQPPLHRFLHTLLGVSAASVFRSCTIIHDGGIFPPARSVCSHIAPRLLRWPLFRLITVFSTAARRHVLLCLCVSLPLVVRCPPRKTNVCYL